MSNRIFKHELKHEQTQVIDLPRTWRPLRFGNQQGTPVIWFENDTGSDTVQRVIHLVFTGEDVPPKARYLGTDFFGVGGAIVVHCYIG